MKNKTGVFSLLLSVIFVAGILSACGRFAEITEVPEPTVPPPAATPEPEIDDTGLGRDYLTVGYSEFGGKFSPFYAKLEADTDIAALTSARLLTTDSGGSTVYNAAGNGVFSGIADLDVSYDEQNDSTAYTWKLRDDVYFGDGVKMTADDIIFSYYVLCDRSYNGPVKVASLPVEGLKNYRSQTTGAIYDRYHALFGNIYALGKSYERTEEDEWTQEQQEAVWASVDAAWENDAMAIVDFCVDNYLNSRAEATGRNFAEIAGNKGLQVAFGMWVWGYGDFTADGGFAGKYTGNTWDLETDYPSASAFADEFRITYGGNPEKYREIESVSETDTVEAAAEIFIRTLGPKDPEMNGKDVASVSGIRKIDDLRVSVTLTGDIRHAEDILGIYVAPLHYYGSAALYDYENNMFGFESGDLSSIKEKNSVPVGAGPFILTDYEDGAVTLKSNPVFYGKEPKIGEIRLLTVSASQRVTALAEGEIDIGSVSPSKDFRIVESVNSESEEARIRLFAFPGNNYGYIGINSSAVKVGDEPDSEESRNLRKAFAVIFAAFREDSVSGAFGEFASVYTAPLALPGGSLNYDKDVDGNDIYVPGMTDDARRAQARAAAVAYLAAAGYIRDENTGKFIEAPQGALSEYEILLPAATEEYAALKESALLAAAALEEIGITLRIREGETPGTVQMRCGIWNSVTGNDMFYIYRPYGGFGNMVSPELNEIIESMRNANDGAFLISASERCAEIIADWAVMIPVYRDAGGVAINVKNLNITDRADVISAGGGWTGSVCEFELNGAGSDTTVNNGGPAA